MKLASKMASEPGPFLVSTAVPLNDVKGEATFLIADFSKSNPKGLIVAVAAYEKSTAAPPKGAENFDPYGLIILNVLLDASDYARLMEAKV